MIEDVTAGYDKLIERFTRWAEGEENVRVAIIIGSRAREDHPADEWSDLDVLLFAEDPEPYRGTEWLTHVGTPWLTFLEPTPDGGGFERRVLFEGGLDVDFIPLPVGKLWAMVENDLPPDLADMIHRGVRFLVDKEDVAGRFRELDVRPPEYTPPSEADFLNLVHDFWYHTVWAAKHLRRGELWWAKGCCDGYLKNLLRRMLAWHARATQGADVDTWMRGRFLEEWADPRAVDALPDVFAHYAEDDVWRALRATMTLFRWVSVETADRLVYPYPTVGAAQASRLVETLRSGRSL